MSLGVASPVRRSGHAEDNGFHARKGFVPFHLADAESTIPERLRQMAARRGDAPAVVDGEQTRTYRALVETATHIGFALHRRLGGMPGPVVVQVPTGLAAVEVLLGVLFSGRAYLYCDPASTSGQTAHLIDAADPAAMVTDDGWAGAGLRPGGPRPQVIGLSTLYGHGPVEAPTVHLEPRDRACLFATSGSTGEPKLVAWSHRALLFDIGRQTNDLYLGPDDHLDLLFSLSFSASLAPIFSALLTGAALHLFDLRDRLRALPEWLQRSGISVSTMSVSTLRALCAGGRLPAVPRLRLVSVGGESLLSKDVAAFRSVFPPACVLQNAMASTETRTYAQYFVPRTAIPAGVVSIGWPVDQRDVTVIDEHGAVVAPGEPGELTVRSRYLADGYVNDLDLSRSRFVLEDDAIVAYRTGDRVRQAADGRLEFLGRVDAVVKIRGYRVDTLGVEAELARHDSVAEAVVVATDAAAGEVCLAAYVVPADGATASAGILREFLSDHLAAHLVPAFFVMLDRIPRTPHGKVDRRALLALESSRRRRSIGQLGDVSTAVALGRIVADVLGRPQMGWTDSFFDCGGDSLSALRVQGQVREQFGVDLPLDVFVTHPTVEQLAGWIDGSAGRSETSATVVPLRTGEGGAPLFCIHGIGGEVHSYLPLARHLEPGRPILGIRAGSADTDASIEELAGHYVAYVSDLVGAETPVHLCGHSFGGIVALEMARQLRGAGRLVGLLAVIDAPFGGSRPRGGLRRLSDTLVNLPAWIRYDAMESSWSRLAVRGAGRAAWLRRRLFGEQEPVDLDPRIYWGLKDAPIHFGAALNARYRAIRSYDMAPYRGPLVLLRARSQPLTGRSDTALGWQSVALGGLTVDIVPGAHDSCVTEPYVRHLARRLSGHLAGLP